MAIGVTSLPAAGVLRGPPEPAGRLPTRPAVIATNRLPLDEHDDEQRRAAFARVFAQHDRWLYAYLMTLLGDRTSADEVFQEACVVLWREYGKFDPATDFRRWASVVALNQVRKFRRTAKRREAWLSDRVVELLAEEAVSGADLLEARRRALHECVGRLGPADRDVVRACYSEAGSTMKEAAERLGRPANTVYKAMARVRRVLHACISRRLAAEGFV